MKVFSIGLIISICQIIIAAAPTESVYNTGELTGPCPSSCPSPGATPIDLEGMVLCTEDILSTHRDCSFNGYIQWSGESEMMCTADKNSSAQYFVFNITALQGTRIMSASLPTGSALVVKFPNAFTEACEMRMKSLVDQPVPKCDLDAIKSAKSEEVFETLPKGTLEWQIELQQLLKHEWLTLGVVGSLNTTACGGVPLAVSYDKARLDFVASYGSVSDHGTPLIGSIGALLLATILAY